MTDTDTAPWNTDAATTNEKTVKKEKTVKAKKETVKKDPAPKKDKEATRPVHIPVSAVKLAESEAKRTEAGLGETVAALITYALNRKAALAKYQTGAKAKTKKPAKKVAKK